MKEVSFGMFLRSLREENGLSQAQLGRLAGVSDKAVSKWESDAARPQSGLLRRLADLLGVTVDELLSCPPPSAGKGVAEGRASTEGPAVESGAPRAVRALWGGNAA